MEARGKYLLGQVLDGIVAIEVEKILCVLSASKITSIPTLKEHLLGVLTWSEAVFPVVDLAVTRPPHFNHNTKGAVAVALKSHHDTLPLAIYFERILYLKDATTAHFNWGDKFHLKHTFFFTECFSLKLKETIDGVMVPILEEEKIINFFKYVLHGAKGGTKWQKPLLEQSTLL